MPYVLNVIVIDEAHATQAVAGELIAEPDSPSVAALRVGDQQFQGSRYLIVTDSREGFTTGMRLVVIPEDRDEPVRIGVPAELRNDFRALMRTLSERSPRRQLVLYLEANRFISRPGDETFLLAPKVHRPMSLNAALAEVDSGAVVEEEIFVVHDGSDPVSPDR